jgi:ATP-binding cassette subfamily B protein
MPLRVTCPNCQYPDLRIRSEFINRRVQCKRCNHVFRARIPDEERRVSLEQEVERLRAAVAVADQAGAEARRDAEALRAELEQARQEGQAAAARGERIALARAFLRQAPIIALDGPTSALDPWAEADWLARFRTLATGRTALIITHRFTTAMHADHIHVMAGGRIVESGCHRQLLALGGRYAQSWAQQTQGEGPA